MSSFRVGFLTSGGDSPGMNAAIRAVVRMVIHGGGRPFAIKEGFRGLCMHGYSGDSDDGAGAGAGGNFLEIVKGSNEFINEMFWDDVVDIASEGGTIIKSSRCPQFHEKKWRLRATFVLNSFGIDRLIVIGGDGSLTGANILREEWKEHLTELGIPSIIDGELHLIGLAGSIDNDMIGTEATIGSDSSLHRIIDAIDCIHSTAASHQRAFIIEVMGRHCGWLALKAAICCAADWLLIPEAPPGPRWEEEMLSMLHANRRNGRSVSIVIVSEGAVDMMNRRITTSHVKDILCSEFEGIRLDARISCLGHIQRGGSPSAYDRYLATLQGIKAAQLALSNDKPLFKGTLVSLEENEITIRPLMECVEKTRLVQERMRELRFEEALNLRDKDFLTNLSMWQLMHHQIRSRMKFKGTMKDEGVPTINPISIEHDRLYTELQGPRKRIGIMTVGAPCGGMNAAIIAANFYGQCRSIDVIGISNGFEGLLKGEFSFLNENSLPPFSKGGTFLGTNRTLPSEIGIEKVKNIFIQEKMDALIIIGGFEAYSSVRELRGIIPIILIPATISNNVPGTDYSIGSDTALNVIMKSCDYVRQSASSSRKRVFIVDVQGGHCGYLATMSAFVSCATRALTGEEGVSLSHLQRDALHFKERFSSDSLSGRIIIRNELSSHVYTAEITSKILEAEGGGMFDSRWIVLGHLQQGGSPSPLDRVRAVRMSLLAMSYLEQLLCPSDKGAERTFHRLSEGFNGDIEEIVEALHTPKLLPSILVNDECVVMGIKGSRVGIRHIDTLKDVTDFNLRRPTERCWDELGLYTRILSKYES